MSIEFSLMLKGNVVNEKLLVDQFNKLANLNIELSNFTEDEILEINSTYEKLGFTITFVKNQKPPFNVYETIFCDEIFEFNQNIVFGFNKEADLRKTYNKALELIFSLMNRLDVDALLVSCVHNDICYFENGTNVYINSEIQFSKQIEELAYTYVKWCCKYV